MSFEKFLNTYNLFLKSSGNKIWLKDVIRGCVTWFLVVPQWVRFQGVVVCVWFNDRLEDSSVLFLCRLKGLPGLI